MQTKVFTVLNTLGLHARPAALLTKTANLFACDVSIIKNTKTANAKSILAVMTLGAKYGDSLTIVCNGTNEIAALEAIETLFEERFGEDQ